MDMARTLKMRKLLKEKARERDDARALVQFALAEAALHNVSVHTKDGKRLTLERLKFYSE